MKTYFTFGQVHRHEIDGTVFDKDCVAMIEAEDYEAARHIAYELFGAKWCFAYPESELDHINLSYYPRGIIDAKLAQA